MTRSAKSTKSSKRAPAPARTGRRRSREHVSVLGIEIDDQNVTAVRLDDGQAAAAYTGGGTSVRERLMDVLASAGPVDDVRVALPLAGAAVTATTVTADLARRDQFEAVAHRLTATHPSTTATAGLFDLDGTASGQTAHGMLLTAPKGAVDEVYRMLDRADAHITVPAANAAPAEGLSLALRDAHAEMTLVLGGRVLAVVELPAGGLRDLDSQLGQGTNVGATRLGAALAGAVADVQRSDPQASEALDQYLRRISAQVGDITSRWAMAGHQLPGTIYVHGRGASAPALPALLASTGLRKANVNGLESALTFTEPRKRPQLVTAYLAALAHDTANAASTFVNPTALEAARAAARAQRRSRRRAVAVSAAVIALVLCAGPVVPAAVEAWQAQNELTLAVERVADDRAVPQDTVRSYLSHPDEAAGRADTETASRLLAAVGPGEVTRLDVAPELIELDVSTADPAAVLRAVADAGIDVTSSHHDSTSLHLTVKTTGGPR